MMKLVPWMIALALLALPVAHASAEDSEIPKWLALHRESQAFLDAGDVERATATAKEALAIAERDLGREAPKLSIVLANLAWCYGAQKNYTAVEEVSTRALAIEEKAHLPEGQSLLAVHLDTLARAIHFQGRYSEAEPLYRRLLEIDSKRFGPEHPRTVATLIALVRAQTSQEHFADAVPFLQRELDILDKTAVPDSSILSEALVWLAMTRLRTGRPTWAEPLCRRALATVNRLYGPDTPPAARCMALLGSACAEVGKYAEAERLVHGSIAILEKAYGLRHADVGSGYEILAGIYQRTDREEQAEKIRKRAKAAGVEGH